VSKYPLDGGPGPKSPTSFHYRSCGESDYAYVWDDPPPPGSISPTMGRTDLGDVMGGCREVRVVDSSELADVRRNFSDPLVGGMNPPQEALQQQGRVVAWQPNGGVYETTGNYGGNRGGAGHAHYFELDDRRTKGIGSNTN